MTGKEIEEVLQALSEYSNEQKKELAGHEQVAAAIAVIKAERAAQDAEKKGAAAKDAAPLEL